MKIGLFGGAFDPFHNGHLAICRAAVSTAGLDRLIVIPTYKAPHKDGFSAGYDDRCRMVELALAGTGAEVSRYEGERGGISYSAVTVEDFRRRFPEDELYFLIGSDSYRDIESWYQPERITAAATLLVFPRGGVEIAVRPHAQAVDMEPVRVSSTEIRTLLKYGGDPEKYMPKAVYKYIKENNLYE